ncbi:uncharacterized protein V1516DRAFT_530909 [Lipomyces oligophaga]|uniref:uncharacterized protein n=1 Tax=Lipomyces oligophaga TaxID=45792 RepID=UPI0034CFDFB9
MNFRARALVQASRIYGRSIHPISGPCLSSKAITATRTSILASPCRIPLIYNSSAAVSLQASFITVNRQRWFSTSEAASNVPKPNSDLALGPDISHSEALSSFDVTTFFTFLSDSVDSLFDAFQWILSHTEIIGKASFEVLAAVHDVTGLRWGFVIPLTCILIRLAISLPVAISAAKYTRNMSRLGSLTKALLFTLMKRVGDGKLKLVPSKSVPASSPEVPQETLVSAFTKMFYSKAGQDLKISNWTLYRAPLINASVIFFSFRGIAQYTTMNPTELETRFPGETYASQGFLWFPNLDSADPFMILPVLFTIATFYFAELMTRRAKNLASLEIHYSETQLFASLTRFIGLFITTLTFFYPVSYTLYLLTSTSYSIIQTWFIDHFYSPVPTPKVSELLTKPTNSNLIRRSYDHDQLSAILKADRPITELVSDLKEQN